MVAGAGVRVAKHGNRSISSRCGSADVLEHLGVRIDLPPERVARAIEEVGIGFLFAPAVHAATRHATPARRALRMRTVFNLLGPLTNPAGASAQLVGVYAAKRCGADGARARRTGRAAGPSWCMAMTAWMKFRSPGRPTSPSCAIRRCACTRVTPEDFGLRRAPLEAIRGGDAKENAEIIHKILGRSLARTASTRPHRDIVLANASAALVAAGRAKDFLDGVRLAAESIDSGAARERLEALIAFSQTRTRTPNRPTKTRAPSRQRLPSANERIPRRRNSTTCQAEAALAKALRAASYSRG